MGGKDKEDSLMIMLLSINVLVPCKRLNYHIPPRKLWLRLLYLKQNSSRIKEIKIKRFSNKLRQNK